MKKQTVTLNFTFVDPNTSKALAGKLQQLLIDKLCAQQQEKQLPERRR